MSSNVIEESLSLKERGNKYFKKKDVKNAFRCYDHALLKLWKDRSRNKTDETYRKLKRDVLMNVTLLLMKEKDWHFAHDHIKCVEKELGIEGDIKVVFRKAECEKGCGYDEGAIKSYKKLIDMLEKSKDPKYDKLIEGAKKSRDFLIKNAESRLKERRKEGARELNLQMNFGGRDWEKITDEEMESENVKNEEDDLLRHLQCMGKENKGKKNTIDNPIDFLQKLQNMGKRQVEDPSKWSPAKRNEMSRRAGRVKSTLMINVKRYENLQTLQNKMMRLPKRFLEVIDEKFRKLWKEKMQKLMDEIMKEPIEKRVESLVITQTLQTNYDFENSSFMKRSRRAVYPLLKEDEEYLIEIYQLLCLWSLYDDTKYKEDDFPYLDMKRRVREMGKSMEMKNEKLKKKNRLRYLEYNERIQLVFKRIQFLGNPSTFTSVLEGWWQGIGGVMN